MTLKDSSPAASTSSTNSVVEEIKTSLKAHNESFDQLLRYIPAKYYIKEENVPAPVVPLTKAQKKAAKKRSNEAATKAAKSDALRQAKLARYDPDEPKTIPEILAAKALAASQKGKARASSSSSWSSASASDVDSDASTPPGLDEEEDSANETDFADSDDDETVVPNGLHHPRENTGPAPSITELRSKLQSRIADIQAHKRGGVAVPVGGSTGVEGGEEEEGKTQSKEELLEQRRKQRGLLRDNRRRKRKAERRDEKPKPKEGERPAPSNGRKGGGKANAPVKEPRNEEEGGEEDRPRKKSKATPPAPKALPTPTPTPIVAAPPTTVVVPTPTPKAPAPDTSLSFSTLDFSTTALLAANGAAMSLGTKVKKNRHALPKDPNAALEVLAKRKERMEGLNPEQRERKEDKDRWEKVGLKAEGEKVRDDEKRLKKMAKRQEKIKSKSAKAWAERKETVSATITAKVAKRNNNMAARAKQVKDKKLGIKTKSKSAVKTVSKSFASRNKGRAGFEGSAGKKGKK